MNVNTGISGKIDRMIRMEVNGLVAKYKGEYYPEDIITKYRDANFLGGQYDYIFDELLKIHSS